MKLQLISSMPCKRFDCEAMCKDGRGGWVFSQASSNRYIDRLDEFSLLLGLNVSATPSLEGDYIEISKLVGKMDEQVVGRSHMELRRPNSGGSFHNGLTIYEWVQGLDLLPPHDGMISVDISLKLHSESDFIAVLGQAYCHISEKDTDHEQVSSLAYRAKNLRQHFSVTYSRGGKRTNDEVEVHANLGHADSQAWCGEFYAMGLGCGPDLEKGLYYLNSAIEAHHPRAMYVKAVLTARGDGVKKDSASAFSLCEIAALAGVADAQYMIGAMYERGDGIEQSILMAIEWFTKAAESGDQKANTKLQQLNT
jgi:hypothetical protein